MTLSRVMNAHEEFSVFVEIDGPRLERALTAVYGPDRAADATAEGLAYAWEHWSRVRAMTNPAGYVYRVARSRGRQRRTAVVFPAPDPGLPWIEPGLGAALTRMPEKQRVCVLLVHGWDWTHPEVAGLLGVGVSTVRNHLARGLSRLRAELGVPSHE